ncbi:APC family permease [Methyloceanibacter caenitepidi]|uniref:Amino acid permease n=1 Tax=Methyloceanibacter caenitepidi TaxID=1384459 RepID=A0A0A8K5B6_9HYPH|nr:APC family permease [Methyloceanibacter caenitepidi]BAQ18100.1 amino acid permease [Methyloceanibacter caenitepidi]
MAVEDVGQYAGESPHSLQRQIGWRDAFWVASGVPALVLFTMGGVAATSGKASWLVWVAAITVAFIQAFTYAEIAGLFPGKSGGAAIHSAIAWSRYGKLFAPIAVWCNWSAWSVVLSIGAGLGAGYVLNLFFAPDAAITSWQIVLADLGWLKEGLTLRINATFIVAATLLLGCFAIQRGGILQSARVTMLLGIAALVPLILIGIVPLFTGDMPRENFLPLAPLAYDAAGRAVDGTWDKAGWIAVSGALFVALWSANGFETAACYTREFKDPARDTFLALMSSGLLCVGVFTLVPLAFQGSLGIEGMIAPGIRSGMDVGHVLADILGGGVVLETIVAVLLILAILLCVMTAMSGAARTSYQGSVEGWLPRYLSHVNKAGAPTNAMWTDLVLNLGLLLMSDYIFVLAATNVSYMVFTFLYVNAGWIHRLDRPHWVRPYRVPKVLLIAGILMSFVNMAVAGLGANIWGQGTLLTGFIIAFLAVPFFIYRHYVQDKGIYPENMAEDMHLGPEAGVATRGGLLPYLALAGAAAVTLACHFWASS